MLLEWYIQNCARYCLENYEKQYLHNPQTVTKNLNLGLIWDMNIQFDNVTMERRPDIVTDNKMDKTAIIIDVAVPGDKKIIDKEKEEIQKQQNLKREIQRLWNLKKIDVIPVVLGGSWECYKEL